MTDKSLDKKEVKPLNPLYVSMPFLFKTTGEVRRCKRAARYTRKLSLDATRMNRSLEACTHLIVTDDTTAYILNADQVAMLRANDEPNIEAMYLNGFLIRPMPEEMIAFLPVEFQV